MKQRKIILLVFFIIIILSISLLVYFHTNRSYGVGDAGISLEEYNKIKLGMTQLEVESIIDSNNLWDDEDVYSKSCIKMREDKNNSVYTYEYKYIGDKSGYVLITYEVDYSDGFSGLKYPEVINIEKFELK